MKMDETVYRDLKPKKICLLSWKNMNRKGSIFRLTDIVQVPFRS